MIYRVLAVGSILVWMIIVGKSLGCPFHGQGSLVTTQSVRCLTSKNGFNDKTPGYFFGRPGEYEFTGLAGMMQQSGSNKRVHRLPDKLGRIVPVIVDQVFASCLFSRIEAFADGLADIEGSTESQSRFEGPGSEMVGGFILNGIGNLGADQDKDQTGDRD